MTDTVDRRIIEIDVRTAAAMQQEVARARQSLAGMEDTLGSLKSTLTGFGESLIAGFSAGAFVAAIRSSMDAIEQLTHSAEKLGVSVESLSALQHAAAMSGVNAEQLDTALTHLNKSLGEFGAGTSAAAKALQQLGVTGTMETEEALGQIADQFARMTDVGEKTRLAMEIFGRAGADLIPMLSQGRAGLEAFRAEAERLGIVVGRDTADAVHKANDALKEMQATTKGSITQITAGLAPALVEVSEGLKSTSSSAEQLRDVGSGLGDMLVAGTKVFLGFGSAVQIAGKAIAAVAASTVAFFSPDSIKNLPAALKSIWEQFKTDFDKISDDYNARIARMQAAPAGLSGPDLALGGPMTFGTRNAPSGQDTEALKAFNNELKSLYDLTGRGEAERMAANLELVQRAAAGMFKDPQTGKPIQFDAVEIAKAFDAVTGAGAKMAAQWKDINDLIGKTKAEEYLANLGKLKEAYEVGLPTATGEMVKITQEEYVKGLTNLAYANKAAAKDSVETFTKMGEAIQHSIEGWSRDAANAIIDFATNVKFSFTDMVNSILKDLARLVMQKAVLDPLFMNLGHWAGSLFGAGAGGGGANVAPGAHGLAFDHGLIPMAAGGIVSSPTIFPFAGGAALMGEAGPEAVMPLTRTASGDLGVKTAGSSDVTVNVINNAGADVSVDQGKDSNGARKINVLIERSVQDAFTRGRFDSLMSGTYGLNRRGR